MPSNHMRWAFLLLSLLAFEVGAATETLFVRPKNDCDGAACGLANGSSYANAYDGWADVSENLTDETANSFDPGDTLVVCGTFGASSADGGLNLARIDLDGGSGNVKTIDGDCSDYGGPEMSTIDCEYSDTVTRGFIIVDADYITVKNLRIQNCQSRGFVNYNVAPVSDARYTTVENLEISNIIGAAVADGTDTRGQYVTITGLTVDYIGEDGIYHKGKNATITNNRVTRVSQANAEGDSIQLSDAFDGYVVTGNYMDHSDKATKQCFIAAAPTDNGAGITRDNICLRPAGEGTNSTYGFYIETAVGNSIVERNYYRGGRTGIQILGAGTADVLSNIVSVLDADAATTARCISIGSSAGQTDVSNNSCVGGYEGIVSTSSTASAIRNNAISTVTSDCINKAAGDKQFPVVPATFANGAYLDVTAADASAAFTLTVCYSN